MEAMKHFRKEFKAEMKMFRDSINTRNDIEGKKPRYRPILTKSPFVENDVEMENFEDKLSDQKYYDQIAEELCRFKGKDFQGSMSYMLEQLISSEVLKKFCFRGSKTKKAFKNTRCFLLLQGNFILLLGLLWTCCAHF